MNDLLIRARYAALKRHKKRQQNGLWCEADCAFHTAAKLTAEKVWATHIGGWTFMYCDTVDRLAKEGLWD
ncbi:hypothetical protein [Nonomuraea candida]|uniref:hypothetical protein n=1 Tax=Nonomuraea candida TaxID=359159 RepID=UPI0005B8C441|nr:hypothetical protein [Nonomuraea candida]